MKKIYLLIAVLFAAALFAGCTAQNVSNASSAAPSGDIAASLGIERPSVGGPFPVKLGTGLSVFGNGEVKANSKEMQAEIDTVDLDKVKTGYAVLVTNTAKNIVCLGIVKSIPDASSVAGKDTCNIEIVLDGDEAAAPGKTDGSEQSASDNGKSMSSTFQMGGGDLPAVDSDVEVMIKLPADPNQIALLNQCLIKGNDGNTYAWVSEKSLAESTPSDFKLTKIETGETDGKNTIIKSGLKAGECVFASAE